MSNKIRPVGAGAFGTSRPSTEMSAVGQAVNQQLAQFEERLLQVLAGGPAVAVQGLKVEPGGESPAG